MFVLKELYAWPYCPPCIHPCSWAHCRPPWSTPPVCDPSCKNDNSQFTTVPLKAMSDQVHELYNNVCNFKNWFAQLRFAFTKEICAFPDSKKIYRNYQNQTVLMQERCQYHNIDRIQVHRVFWSLHWGRFKITLAVPLRLVVWTYLRLR